MKNTPVPSPVNNKSRKRMIHRKKGEHRMADCGGLPRCVTCGADEDDAFVGGEECTYGKHEAEVLVKH